MRKMYSESQLKRLIQENDQQFGLHQITLTTALYEIRFTLTAPQADVYNDWNHIWSLIAYEYLPVTLKNISTGVYTAGVIYSSAYAAKTIDIYVAGETAKSTTGITKYVDKRTPF